MTTMTDHLIRWQTDADELTRVVTAGGDWAAPSPCAGWSAADVLDHLVATQRDFLERHGADLGPAPTGAPAERWAAHRAAVEDALADPALLGREYDGVFGTTTVAATLSAFYAFDLLVHRWDLGHALGQDVTWTGAELDRVEAALDGFGDDLYQDGVCAPPLPVDDDAPRQARLLARMGRRS